MKIINQVKNCCISSVFVYSYRVIVTSMITDIDSFLEKNVKHIGNAMPVEQVILFGSYARGKTEQ